MGSGADGMDSKANDRQVAGDHYKAKIQHWDIVVDHELDYFQAQITKYVMRCKKKNGLVDLKKAEHFIQKYIELIEGGEIEMKTKNVKEFAGAFLASTV